MNIQLELVYFEIRPTPVEHSNGNIQTFDIFKTSSKDCLDK